MRIKSHDGQYVSCITSEPNTGRLCEPVFSTRARAAEFTRDAGTALTTMFNFQGWSLTTEFDLYSIVLRAGDIPINFIDNITQRLFSVRLREELLCVPLCVAEDDRAVLLEVCKLANLLCEEGGYSPPFTVEERTE